jgi:hypothetical protein
MLPDSAPPQMNTAAPLMPAATRAAISRSSSRTSPVASSDSDVSTIPPQNSARLPRRPTSARVSSAPAR